MKFFQQALLLKERARGFHLITSEINRAVPQLSEIQMAFAMSLFNILLLR
jgi:hypothetical protein